MIRLKKLLLLLVLGVASIGVQAEDRHADLGAPPEVITLERFSMDRVADARAHYSRRMRKVKLAINGTFISLGVGAASLIAYNIFKKDSATDDRGNLSKEGYSELLDIRQKIKDVSSKLRPEFIKSAKDKFKADPTSGMPEPDIQRKQWTEYKKSLESIEASLISQRDSAGNSKQEQSGIGWITTAPVKLGLALGLAGLVLTSGQHILRVVSGTLGEALNLWWRGYGFWYNTLEQRVRSTFTELRESLQQARKIAISGYDATAMTRQMRRLGQSNVASTHYRADITMMYQLGLGLLERLIALMYIMAPQDNHTVIYRHIAKIAAVMGRFAESLQKDLNENTHGSLTHYSDKTLELCHEVFENVQIFLTTYRVYLRK